MINLCFILTNLYRAGGVQRVVSIIANELVDSYNIKIVSMFKTANDVPFELNKKIKCFHIFNEYFSSRIEYSMSRYSIKKYFKNIDADYYIVCGMGIVPFFYQAIKSKDGHFIAWEHQNYHFGRVLGFDWVGKRIAINHADHIVVLTETDYLAYKSKSKKENIHQIYNPIVDFKDNYEIKSPDACNSIISVGALIPQKGFDYAIQISKNIKERLGNDNWHWDIYGEGVDRDKLSRQIQNNNLENNLILKGYEKNINRFYAQYSVYCMTSRHEGFPMVLLEASSHGLPIVSFNCNTGPSEIVEDNVNGFLIDCYDIERYSSKIVELLSNHELQNKLSRKPPKCAEKVQLQYVINQWRTLLS